MSTSSDMAPLPGDDYQILCMKLQHSAKAYNKARRLNEGARHPERGYDEILLDAEIEAEGLLNACVRAMGEPVELGATEAGAG